MLKIIYNSTEIISIQSYTPGQDGITYTPEGNKMIMATVNECVEMLANQGIDILPIYQGGYATKLSSEPYIKQKISNLPEDETIERICVVRRIPIMFDISQFLMICEVEHYKAGEYLGQENESLEPEEIINDVWHKFVTTNNIIVDYNGQQMGEFDYYFLLIQSTNFVNLLKGSILNLDQLGRFN